MSGKSFQPRTSPGGDKQFIGGASSGRQNCCPAEGGDPYVFGRGGEEALALSDAGIEFEVVPGITAGIAAAAYAGIPFTHRGITSTAGFITGHEMDGKNESGIDWQSIAGLGTLVFYMGVRNLPDIVKISVKQGVRGIHQRQLYSGVRCHHSGRRRELWIQ